LDGVVFGASDPKMGACGSLYNIVRDERLNHRMDVLGGISEEQCSAILRAFFARLRQQNDIANN
jgi:tRNA(adenine34) deaminase